MPERIPSQPDIRPILELFAAQLRHPNVGAVLKDWRNTLAKGMLHFGRKELLDGDLDFNTLIYTDLNPQPTKSGRRFTLEPKLELVGVVSSKQLAHDKFRYMRNEMVIVSATGRWDYARNEGPYDLKIARDVTVRLPEGAGRGRVGRRAARRGKALFLMAGRQPHDPRRARLSAACAVAQISRPIHYYHRGTETRRYRVFGASATVAVRTGARSAPIRVRRNTNSTGYHQPQHLRVSVPLW